MNFVITVKNEFMLTNFQFLSFIRTEFWNECYLMYTHIKGKNVTKKLRKNDLHLGVLNFFFAIVYDRISIWKRKLKILEKQVW